MPRRRRSAHIASPEDYRRAVEELQRLAAEEAPGQPDSRRAALLASIHDYERKLEGKDLGKGHPRVDKNKARGS